MQIQVHPVEGTSNERLAAQWDALAEHRHSQVVEGLDISLTHVLLPALNQMAIGLDTSDVLEVGCGCGFLTEKLYGSCRNVVAIDISSRSIGFARLRVQRAQNVQFIHRPIEDIEVAHPELERRFSLVMSNMAMMSIIELRKAVNSIARVSASQSRFVFSIVHPCFWPTYWRYSHDWFRYSDEIIVEAPFLISQDQDSHITTTHVHRPLEDYFDALASAGFLVERIAEPLPSPEIERLYPQPWEFPRFMVIRCVRT